MSSCCLFVFVINLSFLCCLLPVCIVKDLLDGLALGRLSEADHVVGRADLHEGEARLQMQRYENIQDHDEGNVV